MPHKFTKVVTKDGDFWTFHANEYEKAKQAFVDYKEGKAHKRTLELRGMTGDYSVIDLDHVYLILLLDPELSKESRRLEREYDDYVKGEDKWKD